MAERDAATEAKLKKAMQPPPKTLPPNSVTGGPQGAGCVPVGRRAHPGRDAALAQGRDPVDPLKGRRPAGT